MRFARSALLASLLAVAGSVAIRPDAARAAWPPPPDATPADMMRSENWPNDPDYGIDLTREGDSGQWYLYSWTPPRALLTPGFHREEAALGTGAHVDRAWGLTTGDPRVLIGVFDSGIQWDNDDLITKAALNPSELPPPQDTNGATVADDANGDGVFNVEDYLGDARVPCGTTLPHNLYDCHDATGAANDPNHNGVFDAGDLIRVFSDGVDDDHNGYIDDICGWDFFKDDNDPYDDTRFGHGTGEARDSTAAANNGRGGAGVCPRCMFVPLRVGDSFITDADDFAQAVVYAVDAHYGENIIRVMQEALGTLDTTRYTFQAIDYAYANNRVFMASAADENSRHHNAPGTANHMVVTHANTYNGGSVQTSTTFLAYCNCTNYGGQLQLSAPATTCSSGAVGHASGMAGLIVSEGLQTNLDPMLTAEEVRQLFIMTVDDINTPESQPTSMHYEPTLYPSLPGWDQRFGYGRTNVRRAVEWVRDRRIPPEVDITGPQWFQVFYADRPATQRLRLEGRIAATRAPSFDYVIQWAPGIEPNEGTWQTLREESNVTAPITNTLAELDLRRLQIDNAGEVENRFTVSFRIRAIAHYGGTIGNVMGEARRVAYVVRDPDLLPGYPVHFESSVESSPHAMDLNGDHRAELVVADSGGIVHALEPDGTELTGWPVHTDLLLGLDPTRTPNYRGSPAYNGPTPAISPDNVYESVVSSPAIADLDHDGDLEVVVLGYHGTVYVWNHDGTPYGHGFPHRIPEVPSSDTSPHRILDRTIFGSPVLYDLDGDNRLEIIFGAADANLYAIDSATGDNKSGFPVEIHFPETNAEYNRIFGSVGVGRFDDDAIPDIAVVSNERPDAYHVDGEDMHSGDTNSGTIYIVHGDGRNHPGGAYHPNYPIPFFSLYLFPLVASGIGSSPAIADLDGDGIDELSFTGTGFPTMLMARAQQPAHSARPEWQSLSTLSVLRSNERGRLSNSRSNPISFINAFSLASFGDMTGDGHPEFVMSGASLGLAINLAGGGTRSEFEHLAGAWDPLTGRGLIGWPRVIEDYTFFQNPVIADVSGDDYAETLIGTGGYYLHAFDACGREAPGFPKFTGQWIISATTVADQDNDGRVEAATATRSGFVYAWHTRGRTDGSTQWPTYRHDPANTGNYGAPLDHGQRVIAGQQPIVCAVPNASGGDAGVDASTDASGPVHAAGGCGCRTEKPNDAHSTRGAAMALALAAVAALRRKKRCSATRC
jgi:MYXO-CTERM domain-containing protein